MNLLKCESIQDEFKIYYKDYLFLQHTYENPCVKVAIGQAQYRITHNYYKIREKIIEDFLPDKFEIKSQNGNKITINFYFRGNKLILTLLATKNYLEITIKSLTSKFNRFKIKILAKQHEAIYGCGAQVVDLNLRGKKVPIWVQEALFPSYYTQPTFISSENYFCHIETSYYSQLDFTNPNYHELYTREIPKKIIIGKFDNTLSVINNLSQYLGRQPSLPDWTYDGVILGIQGGNEIVKEKVNRALNYDIKVSAVWCQDWEGARMTAYGNHLYRNWKYDEDLYPNLPSFIKYLKEKNVKFLGYINPFLDLDKDLYKEASEKGYCIKNTEGNDYQVQQDEFFEALLDLTNPEAVKWFKSVIQKNMLDIGVSGFMADYGEYLPTDAVLYSGISAEEFHNQYPVIFAKIMHELLVENNILDRILIFIRAGYSHSSRYITLYWPGDQLIDWTEENGMPSNVINGLSLGMCGIGNFHFDIGGYITMGPYKRNKEIFMRWAEFGAFTMVMRTHEGSRPNNNWQFDSDDETLEHFSKMVHIHVHLKPYLKNLSKEYQEKGIPPMRSCFLHYENDPELCKINYQYLLGEDLLVAPVLKSNVSVWKVYFPEDIWIHIWSDNELLKGWHEVDAPIGKPPVFYRKNSRFSNLLNEIKNF